MPNWCNNSITITGPRDKIHTMWRQAIKPEEQGGGLLRGICPEPEYAEPTEGQVMPDWWNWRVSNWGTKWEISSEGLEYNEDGDTATITGWFDSAWAPPTEAFKHYGYRNEDVSIDLTYYEPGMCFVGRLTVEGGIDDDDYHEYGSYNSSTVREAIGEYLDDQWNISEEMAQYEEENPEE